MRRLRTRKFRTIAGGFAVLAAVLNAWVLTVHLTSVALTALNADGDGIVICHQGGVTLLSDLRRAGETPLSEKRCPICAGFAALHFGLLSELGLDVALLATPIAVPSDLTTAPRVADLRLQRILNRGPPVQI